MKRSLIIIAVITLIGLLDVSCSKEDTCKTCRLNKYEDGTLTVKGEAVEYCGSDLDKIESEPTTTIGGNTTTKYDCD